MTNNFDFELLFSLGKFTHKLRKEVSEIVVEGKKISEIINFIEKKIFDNGYIPAFPATVSINEIAAHYTYFDEDYVLKKGDVVKVDFGVSFKGHITDNAFTVEIGSNKYEKLIKANLEGLNKIIDKAEVGVTMSELGKTVHEFAKSNGFETIHNLSGHQIGLNNLHFGLNVPNYENNNLEKIKENIEIAIEPFFTEGETRVINAGPSNILHLQRIKPVRDIYAKKLLKHIKENYPFLPFSKRWLLKEEMNYLKGEEFSKNLFDKRKLLYALSILKREGIIYEYDALKTSDNSIVTQFEDTVVFKGEEKIIITRL
jgi:methionyl aminopeptidase